MTTKHTEYLQLSTNKNTDKFVIEINGTILSFFVDDTIKDGEVHFRDKNNNLLGKIIISD